MTESGRMSPAPSATATEATRMATKPRYCPAAIFAVVPR